MAKKRKRNAVKKDVDLISELPDEIIANIISSLTLKQAVATSLISTRWRDLWKHLYSGFFDFDGSSLRKRKVFVDWVNHVLGSHQGATIQRLRIISDLNKPYHLLEIDSWVQLALEKRVQFIELDLSRFVSSPKPFYGIPIYSHCGFKSLKTLFFNHVCISSDALQSLLDNSPNLEKLSVIRSVSLQGLKFSSLSLKYLYLWIFCDHSNPKDFKISVPNLLSFTWNGDKESKLVLEDAPMLKCVNLYGYWYHIRSHHSQLQKLVLSTVNTSSYENEGNIDVPELSNLKYLTMKHKSLNDNSFSHFITYLKAAPLLENFTLELYGVRRDVKMTESVWNVTKNHCYKNLKTVTFNGFAKRKDAKFIRYLLNRAPLLKKITIDCCRPLYLRTPLEDEHRQSKAYLEARDRAIKFTASLSCRVAVV